MHAQDAVRAAVEAVARELALTAESAGLRSSWKRLLEVLALGPSPELRACPHCGGMGMRAATRCGSCWEKLAPPEAGGTA